MQTNRNECDVAIVGSGPAGLQAALVLSRAGKCVVVFDSPRPARNAAAHGVHNFIGLEGLPPAEIASRAWTQIGELGVAERRRAEVTRIDRDAADGRFTLQSSEGAATMAREVLLAFGFEDVMPDVPGLDECWAESVISCPFCDGYEQRDRAWVVWVQSEGELKGLPKVSRNWTPKIAVVAPPEVRCPPETATLFERHGIRLHRGRVTALHHQDGQLHAVSLDGDRRLEARTLLFRPKRQNTALVSQLSETLGLELSEGGGVACDADQATNVPGLWAAGDLQAEGGALPAAAAGMRAAKNILHRWFC